MDGGLGKTTLFLILTFFVCGCHRSAQTTSLPRSNVQISYAKGFSIYKNDDYIRLTVRNPWDTTTILHDYVLVDRTLPLPDSLPEATVVPIPVERIVCLNALHAGLFQDLNVLSTIVAVAEPEYINIAQIQDGLKTGGIKDLGLGTAVDVEKLIESQPELIFASPMRNTTYGNMVTSGVAIAEDASYLEATPLGRAEWIKFIASFFGKLDEADSMFSAITQKYHALKALAEDAPVRPLIFSEKKYGQIWYVPGGRSYMATLFADAGCDYVWKENGDVASIPLSSETVYMEARHCDYWVIKDGTRYDLTYRSLQAEDEMYAHFDAWKKRQVIYTNTLNSRYYEEGTWRPDLILADLIALTHPDLLPSYHLSYFKMMSDE